MKHTENPPEANCCSYELQDQHKRRESLVHKNLNTEFSQEQLIPSICFTARGYTTVNFLVPGRKNDRNGLNGQGSNNQEITAGLRRGPPLFRPCWHLLSKIYMYGEVTRSISPHRWGREGDSLLHPRILD